VYELYLQAGHMDWAMDMAQEVDSLKHHLQLGLGLGIPGKS
jgi:hypothetical protein